MEQEFNFNQLKMDLYGDRSYVTQKWISNYGKLSVYAALRHLHQLHQFFGL